MKVIDNLATGCSAFPCAVTQQIPVNAFDNDELESSERRLREAEQVDHLGSRELDVATGATMWSLVAAARPDGTFVLVY